MRARIGGMTNYKHIGIALLLTACGGSDFHTAQQQLDGHTQNDGGPAATGGMPGADGAAQGTGGSGSGVATGGAAGSTGGAQPGSGGAAGSTGGASEADGGAGAPTTGGAPGTGGSPDTDGGQADSGTVKPVCKPPVVTDQNMPSTVVWDSYLNKSGTDCLECVTSPCTTCTVYWWPVTQSADGLTVTAVLDKSECPLFDVKDGPCDTAAAALACGTYHVRMSDGETVTLGLAPKADGTGYSVASYATGGFHGSVVNYAQGSNQTCLYALSASRAADKTADAALQAAITAATWPCGS